MSNPNTDEANRCIPSEAPEVRDEVMEQLAHESVDSNNDYAETPTNNYETDRESQSLFQSDTEDFNPSNEDDQFQSSQEEEEEDTLNTANNNTRDSSKGCAHYERNCRTVAPCCNEIFDCRICHDTVKNNPTGDILSAVASDTNFHELNRFGVKEISCRQCNHRQPVSNICKQCGVEFAKYFCSICNLWDNDGLTKGVFHCEGCGICRVGGRENFFHCPTCDCCYPLKIQNKHKCLEKAMHSGCSICLEDMFNSLAPVLVLECGHTFHQQCLNKLMRSPGIFALRCPLCFKSFTDNKEIWEKLDEIITENPLPETLSTTILIKCHDCEKLSKTNYHFYGLKCCECGSYNTRRRSEDEEVQNVQ